MKKSTAVQLNNPKERMSPLQAWKIRTAAQAAGRLSEQPLLNEAMARVLIARARLPGTSIVPKLTSLLTACRRARTSTSRSQIKALLRPYLEGSASSIWRENRIGWERYFGDFADLSRNRAFGKTLVLKAPQKDGEKGVIYAPFEYNLMRLVACYDAESILSEYMILGASSWSPTDFAPIASLSGLSQDPIFLGISNPQDSDGYEVMSPIVRPAPMLASDLIDPDFYAPRPRRERSIDILMVANWMSFKRHWLLFEALRDMPADLRVVLVGRNAPGRTVRELRAEAKAFGARQEIEYLTNIPIEEVVRLQCDARISAVFSYREGSCLAVTESFFANTPVAMMKDSHVGSKAYINKQTGVLLERQGLAEKLMWFLSTSDEFRPRKWAVGKVDCYTTSQRLNEFLRKYSSEAGLPWTTDIVPFCRRYVPEYARPEDAIKMQQAERALEKRHGVEFKKFVYRPSSGALT